MENKSRIKREEIIVAVILVVLVAVLLGTQAFKSRRELSRLREKIERLKAEVEKLKWVERDRANLEDQIEEKTEQLEKVRAWLPDTWEDDVFREDFAAWAGESGVVVDSLDLVKMKSGRRKRAHIDEMEVEAKVSGEPEGLRKLFSRRNQLGRIVRWETTSAPPNARSLVLKMEIFRAPYSTDLYGPFECPSSDSGAWLWPFDGGPRHGREEIAALCAEIEKHSEVRRLLRVLESQKNELDVVLELINSLESENGVIIPERLPPGPSDPESKPPEKIPVPADGPSVESRPPPAGP